MRLADLRDDVLTRLGDPHTVIWTTAEVDARLRDGYLLLASTLHVFWDQVFLENLPASFSYTQPWEKEYLSQIGGFDAGCANFTAEVDRRALGDERQRYGPANHTSPFEATDGWLSNVGLDTSIPATAELPTTLTAIDRVLWDRRAIDAMEARRIQAVDSRYEITKGEVYGFLWQKDGIRTLRKVRVPAAQSDSPTVTGNWGIVRNPSAVATTDATPSGTWGIPRQIPGQHPMGATFWGTPRRFFLDGKNVRVEHFRQGRAMTAPTDVCELPDRYALYLRDYAQGKCLARPGPGQDLQLADHFDQRWQRGLARIARRLRLVDAQRVVVMGGDGRPSVSRPPRPSRPWPYGSVVR